MKLAVVGAGAMGGALAAEADRAGHDVTILDVSIPLVERVNAYGLEIRGDQAFVSHPRATTDAAAVGIVDVVVVFVKAQHTRSTAPSILAMRDDHTVVVSLQNGWGNADALAELIGAERLVYGVTYNSCSIVDLGVVNHSGRGETYIGGYGDTDAQSTDVAAELLGSSGWSTKVSASAPTEIWKKLILNAATLPTASLTGLTAGALGESEQLTPLVEGLAREATLVARSLGLDIEADERVRVIRETLARAGSGKPSMLQDVEARRKTENEVINAAVVRAGASTGVPTPLNSAMTALISGLEQSWVR